MRRLQVTFVFALVAVVGLSAQPSPIVTEVRAAIKAGDFAAATQKVTSARAAAGWTAELLEAFSWIGRGYLAAGDLDKAETTSLETYRQANSLLKTRSLDAEPRLPTALGASIEVIAQVQAKRGQLSEAVAFLQKEFRNHQRTSIAKRIQKNVNLISMEGHPAPALELNEYLGAKPPSLSALKGKVVLLFFWAHWCNDCKQQGPILATLADKYRDRGLVILAPTQRFGYVAGGKSASADEERQYIAQVRQQYYPVLAGQPVPISEANHVRYGVSSTPTLVLVDREGIVRLYNPGRLSMEQLEPKVTALLGAASSNE